MLLARQREDRIFELRIKSWSIADIAEELKMSESGVQAALTRTIERVSQHMRENARELLTMDLERYDCLLKATWLIAIGEEVVPGFSRKDAVKECREIIKARDKLAGLESVLTVQHLHRFSAEELRSLRDKRWDAIEDRVVHVLTSGPQIVVESDDIDLDVDAEATKPEVIDGEFIDAPSTERAV